jgi:hypothetical protein
VTVSCQILIDEVFVSERQRFLKTQAHNFFLWPILTAINAFLKVQKSA